MLVFFSHDCVALSRYGAQVPKYIPLLAPSIQPLVLERLPCYDFTPVIGFALGNLFFDQLWAPPTSVV